MPLLGTRGAASAQGFGFSGATVKPPEGGIIFTNVGTYWGSNSSGEYETHSFVVPAGVTSISAVAVGGGGGSSGTINALSSGSAGGGGALAYSNNIPVTPGETLTVRVGLGGRWMNRTYTPPYYAGDSGVYRSTTALLVAKGGACGSNASGQIGGAGGQASGCVGQAAFSGGSGGTGTSSSTGYGTGGGGAAGYAGSGGNGAPGNGGNGDNGNGGGGGGGGANRNINSSANKGARGGGACLFGLGPSGLGSAFVTSGSRPINGSAGSNPEGNNLPSVTYSSGARPFGVSGAGTVSNASENGEQGYAGGVRVLFNGGAFPSANVSQKPAQIISITTVSSSALTIPSGVKVGDIVVFHLVGTVGVSASYTANTVNSTQKFYGFVYVDETDPDYSHIKMFTTCIWLQITNVNQAGMSVGSSQGACRAYVLRSDYGLGAPIVSAASVSGGATVTQNETPFRPYSIGQCLRLAAFATYLGDLTVASCVFSGGTFEKLGSFSNSPIVGYKLYDNTVTSLPSITIRYSAATATTLQGYFDFRFM